MILYHIAILLMRRWKSEKRELESANLVRVPALANHDAESEPPSARHRLIRRHDTAQE